MKKAALMAVVLILVVSLAGCGGISVEDGKRVLTEFLDCIEIGDYEGAEALTYPSLFMTASSIEKQIKEIEENRDVDFLKGVTIKHVDKITTICSTSGSSLEMEGTLWVDGKTLQFRAEIKKLGVTYGVSDFKIT